MQKLLIVGLGNPGSAYEVTRHNMGHMIIRALAKDFEWRMKKDSYIKGELTSGEKHGKEVYLLLPTTFMNNSGLAVSRTMQMFQIESASLLVVTDDVYIPFGQFRLREKGSPGGHNGVKSVTDHLVTSDFHRLKVGIGAPFIGNLEEFVLGQYTQEEYTQIPKIIDQAHVILDFWIRGDLGKAKEIASSTSPNRQGEV